jgi:uncharacterized protein YpmS
MGKKPIATRTKKKIKVNGWKIAFLILLGLILGTGAFFATRIFSNREPNITETSKVVDRDGSAIVTINSKKAKVNQMISFFLEKYQKNSDIKYEFSLKNEAMLTGTIKIFNAPVKFYLYFDPYVTEDGNVQLKAKSLSVGTLGLPIKDVMRMLKNQTKFPDWVEVDTDSKTILLRLDKFQMTNGLFIKAERINLIDDDIKFSLYLPKQKASTSSSSKSSS